MKNDFLEIIKKMGTPLYYDYSGAPKYVIEGSDLRELRTFLNGLNLIECQACRKEFIGQVVHPVYGTAGRPKNSPKNDYGDPPVHGCTGDTMTPETERELTDEEKARFLIDAVRVYERLGFDNAEEYEKEIGDFLKRICPKVDNEKLIAYIDGWAADPIGDLTPPPSEFYGAYIELKQSEELHRKAWEKTRRKKAMERAEKMGLSVPDVKALGMAEYSLQRHRKEAISLLGHYFETAFQAAGLSWNSDNRAEMATLADELIDAAVAKMNAETIRAKGQ